MKRIDVLIPTSWQELRYRAYRRYLFARYPYTEAYRRFMEFRIDEHGAEQAVGGCGTGIGELQFEFLKRRGLSPENSLLDIGCGCLRGGEYFIDYLDAGNYTGMDISESAIQAGMERIGRGKIRIKSPRFVVNNDLLFDEFETDDSFDYAIAQSVFTHLPMDTIEECLRNIDKVVDRRFFATFFDHPLSQPSRFGYEEEEMVTAVERNGNTCRVFPNHEYPHPRGQRMMEIRVGMDAPWTRGLTEVRYGGSR